jgi:thymidylate synthase (FAD)
MTAKLVWITPESESVIGYCARVSNPANQDNPDVVGLLRYCIRNQHLSIFEMANACIEINTSRSIARQILRHRSFSFQEFSQRYAEADEFELVEARRQDKKNRQNSIDDLPYHVEDWWFETQNDVIDLVKARYKTAIEMGIAKECARAILPEGLTQSRLYMNGTIRSWLTYLKLRLGNGTQSEHVQVAREILEELRPHIPTILEAYEL